MCNIISDFVDFVGEEKWRKRYVSTISLASVGLMMIARKQLTTECEDLYNCKKTKRCDKRHPKRCKRYSSNKKADLNMSVRTNTKSHLSMKIMKS